MRNILTYFVYTALFFLTAISLLAAACADGNDGESQKASAVDETKPMLQPDGPLRGLVMATGVSDKRTIVEPRFSFTTDDREAVAVVTLGSDVPENATLTVAWYRLTGVEGRESLFSHEIQVGPGLAYSRGIARGGLAPGVYETVATLGARQVRIPWVVRAAPGNPGTPSGLASFVASSNTVVSGAPPGLGAVPATLFATSLAQTSTPEPEPWEVPGPGDYDYNWGEPEAPPTPPQPPGPCTVNNVFPGFNPLIDVEASVNFMGTCSEMALAATVSGPPMTVVSTRDIDPNRPSSVLNGEADICGLPGGSDIPGTVVHWSATGSEGASGAVVFTVPDFGETLEAIIQSDPEGPARVETGETIELRGMAVVMPPALGVKELSVFAGDELLQKVGNASESSAPQPCDFGRYGAVNRTRYTVPADPPPVIEICAEAVGFDGTKSRACTEFYTGEVWEGTVKVKGTYAGTATCTSTWEGTIRFTVGDDGSIQGVGTISNPGEYLCSVPAPQPPAYTTSFTVSGKATDAGFRIDFGGVIRTYASEGLGLPPSQVEVSRSGNSAVGSSVNTYPGGGASASIEQIWNLECTSCDNANI